MSLIKPELMGDVWPAVEPGQNKRDYGSAVLEPRAPCMVRSFQTFALTYTAGKYGLDDTGAIRIAFRFVHDGGAFQTDDPDAANYVTASASNAVGLKLFVEPYAYRPWLTALRVTVTGGYLREGDTITVVFGDRSGGSPGMRMQTICEDAFEFKVSVDACATGQFAELEDRLHVQIVPGPPHSWHVVAPGLRRPGDSFAIGIRAEDVWNNPTLPENATLLVRCDRKIGNLPDRVEIKPGERSVRMENLVMQEEGTATFTLSDASGNLLATSNPLVIRDGNLAGYWGDLHGQSGETVGINSFEAYQSYARDLAFLDVSSHQANDFQVTNPFWDHINKSSDQFNEDGKFVCFPGYEWSGNTPVGGDHNVFFRESGRKIRRSSHAMLVDRSDIDTDASTLPELFDALSEEDCVLYAHVGGRPADVSCAHDAKLKTAVEVHSNWGTFEWILTDSLKLGHRIGVVANSDGHKGRPGAGAPGATEFGAYGGLTCFLAPQLTRSAIFESMRRRHHYATTGSRMHLEVDALFSEPAVLYHRDPDHFDDAGRNASKAVMGDIVAVSGPTCRIKVSVSASSPIERIDLFNGSNCIKTARTYSTDQLGNRLRVYWKGAQYRGRGRNVHWQGKLKLHGGAISRFEPVNHWNHERQLEQAGDGALQFDAVTSGNFAGVDLFCSLSGDTALEIKTNLVSGSVDVTRLGMEDQVLEAGGLDRQIVIRRLPDELTTKQFDFEASVDLLAGMDNPFWVRVQTLDGHLAWSSPIYVIRK